MTLVRASPQTLFIKFDGKVANAHRCVDGLLPTAFSAHTTADGIAFYGALQPLERCTTDAGDAAN